MESVNPANKHTEPKATGSPQPLQISTPDPREATRPVRIAQSKPANLGVSAQPMAATAPELENTRPVQIRIVPAQTPPAATPGDELPAWLISFAAQETKPAAPANPEEDTRAIPLQLPDEAPEPEAAVIPSHASGFQAPEANNGWTAEIPPEPGAQEINLDTAAQSDVGEIGIESRPETAAAEQEDLPGEVGAAMAEDIVPQPSGSGGLAAETSAPPGNPALENSQAFSLEKALDESRIEEAGAMLMHMKSDPAARACALQVLRSRLDLRAESLPLWQYYAELCSAANQPGLARQALETAEKLKIASGEEHGTIAGIG